MDDTSRFLVLDARMRQCNSHHPAVTPIVMQTPVAPASAVPTILTMQQAAKFLQVSLPTLRKLGIPVFRQGRVVRVRRSDLDAWINGHVK